MSERDPTCIGRVRHVLGSTVTVALDGDLAGTAPIYRGQLLPIGQIGSLVRLPQGLVQLVATVSLVGIAELAGAVKPTEAVQRDERWLQVHLLGEIDIATGRFRRGVGTYPGLDDPVHFATGEHLAAVFPPPCSKHLRIGRLAAAETVPVCIDAARLVVRHAAVVGSTGSGKTSAVASLLQGFVRGGWSAANIVVIDPHGEYASAVGAAAAVRSVLGSGLSQLTVPYWALPAADVLRVLTGVTPSATVLNRFSDLVAAGRREFVRQAAWPKIDASVVTADTPVPFDIKAVWLQLEHENRETRNQASDPKSAAACCEDQGDSLLLKPPVYRPYGPGNQAPHKGPLHGTYGNVPTLLRNGLMEPQLEFLRKPVGDPLLADPLAAVVPQWLGDDKPVSVLDFSGVPSGAADVAIGVVLTMLFEIAARTRVTDPGIGRPSPVLVVLEEAHRYLGEGAHALTRTAANRIAREGRKYGVGLVMVSQRPTELPKTALAQCGTIVALRLSNSEDQGAIRATLPDSVSGLAAVLPSLRTHEAVVSGEAVVVPVRVILDEPDPWPKAEDPSLAAWRRPATSRDVSAALAAWRGTYS